MTQVDPDDGMRLDQWEAELDHVTLMYDAKALSYEEAFDRLTMMGLSDHDAHMALSPTL